jgi:hypothetical protein
MALDKPCKLLKGAAFQDFGSAIGAHHLRVAILDKGSLFVEAFFA